MKKDNITCIQRAQFVLHFFESGEWREKKESPYERLVKNKKVRPEDIQELRCYTSERMARTEALFRLLLTLHDDWEVTAKKDCLILETETMDFEAIVPTLKTHGFSENDYVLYTEYTRKWGML